MQFLKPHCVKVKLRVRSLCQEGLLPQHGELQPAKQSQTAFPSRFMLGTGWRKAAGDPSLGSSQPSAAQVCQEESELPTSGVRTWHHTVIWRWPPGPSRRSPC